MAQGVKNRILINLLPPEFMAEEIKSAKFYKIQTIGVGIILTMIFLSSLTVALRILQSSNISRIEEKLGEVEGKVLVLKDRQASLMLLKNRLTTISQNLGAVSKQNDMYTLLDRLIPQSVSITSLSVDKTGNAAIVALVPDSNTLDSLVINLYSKEKNEDKIGQVSVESLNRGRDGLFRVSLKVVAK